MAVPNPNRQRITDQVWEIWVRFDALEPTALLGGIYAAKPGYHNYRLALPGGDYSVGDVAADRQGPQDKAAAIDLTMSAAAMRLYTGRLDVAARARDERLYIDGHPIIREFIGTKDNRSVYCYVLVGGRPLGVGADAGPDPGRDATHLWHLHISFIRRFLAHPQLAPRVMSVLSGESLAAWRARTTTTSTTSGGDMQQTDRLANRTGNPNRTVGNVLADVSNLRDWLISRAGTAGMVTPPAAGSPLQLLLAMAQDWAAESNRQRLRDEAILAAVKGLTPQEILARVDLRAAQQIEALHAMRTQIAQELAPLLVTAVGQHLAGQVAPEMLADAQEMAIRRVLGSLDGPAA
ncbi:hypothetical protein [Catenuloplanes indicus]|uniref:Uncharacterized protein n=1 Tax=Catenuloplanes indicus TaxID=137267 RepID=A0AAE3W860_9ACTN|nr:hypothetical protein [Catenuloplanes indicus]MDQ0371633.1 hypothetical protein [Catenuloplanes indicus]